MGMVYTCTMEGDFTDRLNAARAADRQYRADTSEARAAQDALYQQRLEIVQGLLPVALEAEQALLALPVVPLIEGDIDRSTSVSGYLAQRPAPARTLTDKFLGRPVRPPPYPAHYTISFSGFDGSVASPGIIGFEYSTRERAIQFGSIFERRRDGDWRELASLGDDIGLVRQTKGGRDLPSYPMRLSFAYVLHEFTEIVAELVVAVGSDGQGHRRLKRRTTYNSPYSMKWPEPKQQMF